MVVNSLHHHVVRTGGSLETFQGRYDYVVVQEGMFVQSAKFVRNHKRR